MNRITLKKKNITFVTHYTHSKTKYNGKMKMNNKWKKF